MSISEMTWSCDINAPNAPKVAVWRALTEDASFRRWTETLSKGSRFVGDWSVGGQMRFIGGNNIGLISEVIANTPGEKLHLAHIGEINGARETLWQDRRAAREHYDLSETDDATTMRITVDIPDQHRATFERLWPKALAKLAAVAEQLADQN